MRNFVKETYLLAPSSYLSAQVRSQASVSLLNKMFASISSVHPLYIYSISLKITSIFLKSIYRILVRYYVICIIMHRCKLATDWLCQLSIQFCKSLLPLHWGGKEKKKMANMILVVKKKRYAMKYKVLLGTLFSEWTHLKSRE